MLRTPFARVGNKTKILKDILQVIPTHKKYIEAFVGSGAVFFAKEKVDKSVINDLDENIYNLFNLLPNISSNKEDYNFIKGVKEIQEYVNQDYERIEDQFYKRLLIMCNTFCCLGKGKIYKEASQHTKFNHIKKYQEKLQNTKILNKDYKKVIEEEDEEDAFIFLDPPYENSKQLYKNDTMDFVEMASILKNVKGKFLLTINDSDNIKDTFKGFYIKEIEVKAYGNSALGNLNRKELFITNYII